MSEIGLFLSQFSIDHAVVFFGVVTSDFKSSEFLFSTHIYLYGRQFRARMAGCLRMQFRI